MRKLLTILVVAIILLITSPKLALAANLNVACSQSPSGCTVTGDNPLFSQALDGLWYPGRELTKIINLKNVSSDIRQMGIGGVETSLPNNLKQVMSVTFTDSGGAVIWSGSLSDFYNQDGIVVGTFNPGEDKDYYFKVAMDHNAGNAYQGLQTVFDLTLGFWGDVISPTFNTGGSGDNLSDNLGCSTHDCSATANTSPGQVLGISRGPATLKLAFTPGVEQKVLGKQTPTKQVLGRQTNSYCTDCLWWQIILGEIIALLIYYWLVFYKNPGLILAKRKFVWGLVIPIVAYIIFLILNKGCLTNYFFISSKNIFCQWFWLIDLVIYTVITYLFYLKVRLSTSRTG